MSVKRSMDNMVQPERGASMAIRSEWKVNIHPSHVKIAAEGRANHHDNRAAEWVQKKKKIMESLREGGIQITETAGVSNYTNTVGTMEVKLDQELQRQLMECQQKIKDHQRIARDYREWAKFIHAMVEKDVCTVELSKDDYTYFFNSSEPADRADN